MNTPICDFVRNYKESNALRLHMPGHKGIGPLGCEMLDITEISGADTLYDSTGIIAESEANASTLFGCSTFYSTEGSSHCIRAMLYLAMLHAKMQGKHPRFAAGRNAHKTFLSAAALLDADVFWLYPQKQEHYLCCTITAEDVQMLPEDITTLYITSPDYLGNMVDIAAISAVCNRRSILLLVDNAHGAYLRFLQPSLHPMDLGADLCCDSAHKTLPVLTGGAYLHIRNKQLEQSAKNALSLFGSTSPSYLILQSLDAANHYLSDGYTEELARFIQAVEDTAHSLKAAGYVLYSHEPLKLVFTTKERGYTGYALADLLHRQGIECEFADPDHLVFMLTPNIGIHGLQRMQEALQQIPKRNPICTVPPPMHRPEAGCTIRQAMFSPSESIPVEQSEGRILASASVGCPPAVPILVCGERIDHKAINLFHYYGIKTCQVIR